MEFRIANTFVAALARLPAVEQKAVKTSAFDLQIDPTSPGLSMHRIGASKDPSFWSVRVNRDIRIIVHKTSASVLLAYVDHHDQAYIWAVRRRIEAHPHTGAVQIVEVRERIEELQLLSPVTHELAKDQPPIFAGLTTDDLLSIGVPNDWIDFVAGATETQFFELAPHLPSEASEALLEYATTGELRPPCFAPVLTSDQRDSAPAKSASESAAGRSDDDWRADGPSMDEILASIRCVIADDLSLPRRSAESKRADLSHGSDHPLAPATGQTGDGRRVDEPSMDEILASMRRIIADDQSLPRQSATSKERDFSRGFNHPHAHRRFKKVSSADELAVLLEAPWSF